MFSKASSSSISLATVTPSLVTCGPPKDLPIITFLPFGPNVTLTAFAKASTPFLGPLWPLRQIEFFRHCFKYYVLYYCEDITFPHN